MSVNQHCFFPYNFNKMKTLLRISTLVSLLLMISMTAFCQAGTVAMKFSTHPPPNPSASPYYAYYYIRDVTNGTTIETSLAQVVSPTQENDYQFSTYPLTSTDTYRFVAYVWDSSGYGYNGWGSSATFTGAQYNLGGLKKPVDIIYL
jgi:hypothetical protein